MESSGEMATNSAARGRREPPSFAWLVHDNLLEDVADGDLPAGDGVVDLEDVGFRQEDGVGGGAMHLYGSPARVDDYDRKGASGEPVCDLLLDFRVAATSGAPGKNPGVPLTASALSRRTKAASVARTWSDSSWNPVSAYTLPSPFALT